MAVNNLKEAARIISRLEAENKKLKEENAAIKVASSKLTTRSGKKSISSAAGENK